MTTPTGVAQLPNDVLITIFSYAQDNHTLSNVALVNKTWYNASCSDVIWQTKVPIDCDIPKKKDSRGFYRGLYISISKEVKRMQRKREREQRFINFQSNIKEKFGWNGMMPVVMFICGTIFFITVFSFFILLALRDTTSQLHNKYIFISLWLAFLSMTIFIIYQAIYGLLSFKFSEEMILGIGCFIFLVYGIAQGILVFVNLGVLSVSPPTDTIPYTRYSLSWSIVLIPTFILVGVAQIGGIVATALDIWRYNCYRSGYNRSWRIIRLIAYLIIPMSLVIASILFALNGDYPIYVPIWSSFIPIYFLQICAAIWLIYFLYYNRKYIDIVWCGIALLLLFNINLAIVEIIVSLNEYTHSYAWFSALLPITILYIVFVMFCVREGRLLDSIKLIYTCWRRE
jgi:hypothetical protein